MLLLFCTLLSLSIAAPEIVSSNSYVKENITVLGDTFSFGVVEFEFDQDLYVYRGGGSRAYCTNVSCHVPGPCPPCNYTDPAICNGTVRGPGQPCECPHPPFSCSLLGTTPVVPRDGNITINTPDAIVLFHPDPPDECHCILFKWNTIQGITDGLSLRVAEIMVSRFSSVGELPGEPWETAGNGIARGFGMQICPNNPAWGKTLVIVIGRRGTSPIQPQFLKTNLTIFYRPLPYTTNPYPATCEPPTAYQGTHLCLAEGRELRVAQPAGSIVRMVLNPSIRRNGILTFWSRLTYQVLISKDPWVSSVNSTGAWRLPTTQIRGGIDNGGTFGYDLEPGESIFIWANINTPFGYFFADTSQYEWTFLTPLSYYSFLDYQNALLNAYTLNCGNKSFTPSHSIWNILDDIDSGSTNVRAIYPAPDHLVLSKYGPFATEEWGYIRVPEDLPPTPKKIAIAVVLNQRLAPRQQPLANIPYFPIDYEWLTKEEFETCTITFNGLIADKIGDSLRGKFNASQFALPPGCPVEEYSVISTQIGKNQNTAINLTQQSSSPTLLSESLQLEYSQDVLVASNAFQFCAKEVQEYATYKRTPSLTIKTSQCTSPFQSPQFDNDPCCSFDPNTAYSFCRESARSIEQIQVDQFNIPETCESEICTQTNINVLVNDFNREKNPDACLIDTLYSSTREQAYWRCFERIFGSDPFTTPGTPCFHDSDCTLGGDEHNHICSTSTKRCLDPIEETEDLFLDCLIRELSTFQRVSVTQRLGLNPNSTNLTAEWKGAFSTPLTCGDPYSPGVARLLDSWIIGDCPKSCSQNFPGSGINYMFTFGPQLGSGGYGCWNPPLDCSPFQSSRVGSDFCSQFSCNVIESVFPYTDNATCRGDGNPICGLCENDFFCRNITDIIAADDCDDRLVCVLANGTIFPVTSEDECNSTFSCDVPCNGIECADQDECIAGGVCSDTYDPDFAIWTRSYASLSAGCFFDLNSRGLGKRQFGENCLPPLRKTVIGCALFEPNVTQQECESGTFNFGSRDVFQAENRRWLTRAQTPTQCTAFGQLCRTSPQRSGVSSYKNDFFIVQGDNCDQPEDIFEWREGRWLPGQLRTTTRTIPQLKQRFKSTNRTGLDFKSIYSVLSAASFENFSLQIESRIFCHSTAKKLTVDDLLCSCGNSNLSVCQEPKQNVTNLVVACAASETAWDGFDASLFFGNNSIPDGECISFRISKTPITVYSDSALTVLKTLLVSYEEDSEWAIRKEDNLAIIGKVLTDGLSARFPIDSNVTNITICLRKSRLRGDYESETFPVLDLGARLPDSESLIPMEVDVYEDGDFFCARLDEILSDVTVHFIQRADNWIYLERTVFTGGEIAYLSVLLALYAIGLIVSLFKIMQVLIYGKCIVPSLRLGLVLSLMGAFFVFRTVLFAMLISNSLLTYSPGVSYVLFEFPVLLYFWCVVYYILNWVTLLRYSQKWQPSNEVQNRFTQGTIFTTVFSLCLLLLFIIIIILFQTIIPAPQRVCAGIIVFEEEKAFALLMAYRAIFSFVAFLIGALLFIVALFFFRLLSDPAHQVPISLRGHVLLISVVGGLGLIAQAIYFLVVTAVRQEVNNYLALSILLVVEIFPALLLVTVSPTNTKALQAMTTNSSHN